ncbi:MAG: hypothetical protein ACI814_004690 [Mariniblastus sp.]|jgi:hypothetical protein
MRPGDPSCRPSQNCTNTPLRGQVAGYEKRATSGHLRIRVMIPQTPPLHLQNHFSVDIVSETIRILAMTNSITHHHLHHLSR